MKVVSFLSGADHLVDTSSTTMSMSLSFRSSAAGLLCADDATVAMNGEQQ